MCLQLPVRRWKPFIEVNLILLSGSRYWTRSEVSMGRPWLGGRQGCKERKKQAGICVDCPRPVRSGVRCDTCKTRNNNGRLLRHAKLKDEVFAAYGGYRCQCCGETHREFLHIDHADGQGARHRQQIGDRTGANMYSWLKKHGFPPGFRVLCANCNWSYGRYGYCPHQRAASDTRPGHFITPEEQAVLTAGLEPGGLLR